MTRIVVIRAFIRYLINLVSHCLSGASTLHSAPTVPAHPYNLDQLITEDGTVTIEQPILSLEEATIHHLLLSSSASATRTGLSADNHIADFQDLPKLSAALHKEAAAIDVLSFAPRGIPMTPSFDWNT